MKSMRMAWAALGAALVLSACGGGSGAPEFKSVVVFGDSLADVGTFGFKFTVQKAGDAKGYPVWPQIVSDAVKVSGASQCNGYVAGAGGFTRSTNAACTNYAIGGGRIVTGAAQGGSASPLRVATQMAAHPGGFSSNQLVLIDGGGNDAADLVGAYLGAAGGAAGASAYQAFLSQQLSATTLASLFSSAGGAERAAGAYMAALADTLYASVKTQVLDRGATNVAILNVPDITLTPRFRAVLGGVSAQAGAATATALQAGIREWTKAFNDRLRTLATGEPRVVIVDFNGTFTQQVTTPAAFGLTNATDTACPITGVDSTGLPAYNFLTCTDTALDATAGRTPGWWKTYTFSDGFHPTPLGHQLLADTVISTMRTAGWL